MSNEILDLLVFPEHRALCFSLLSDVTRGEIICAMEARGATLQDIADHFRLSVRRVHSLRNLGTLEPRIKKLFLRFRLSETRMRYLLALREGSHPFQLENLVWLVIRYQATGSEIRAWAEHLRRNPKGNPEQALRRICGHWMGPKVSASKRHYAVGGGGSSKDGTGARASRRPIA